MASTGDLPIRGIYEVVIRVADLDRAQDFYCSTLGLDAGLIVDERGMRFLRAGQGGMLVRLQAISSGNRFCESISETPFDEVSLEPETRALLRDVLFFEPQLFGRLPEVSSEGRHLFDVGFSGGRREVAYLHVLDHSLTKSAHRHDLPEPES